MHKEHPVGFTISIVSHGHRNFVFSVLTDLANLNRNDIDVVVTWNLKAEQPSHFENAYPFRIISLVNDLPKGFAANHNAAFQHCSGKNFVVLNPDISIPVDPFPEILEVLEKYTRCICAPTIVNSQLAVEDSARSFPSPYSLTKKAFVKLLRLQPLSEAIPEKDGLMNPDWIAGMFMVIPAPIYQKLGGLEERYHLYYEDVDFCARARLAHIEIYVIKHVAVIHHAQRTSHTNWRFFKWHLTSAARFFLSRAYLSLSFKRLFAISAH
jgi:N-acetylglucosaminyl-diphospho-decaprenol L-rhamnosyltransferase